MHPAIAVPVSAVGRSSRFELTSVLTIIFSIPFVDFPLHGQALALACDRVLTLYAEADEKALRAQGVSDLRVVLIRICPQGNTCERMGLTRFAVALEETTSKFACVSEASKNLSSLDEPTGAALHQLVVSHMMYLLMRTEAVTEAPAWNSTDSKMWAALTKLLELACGLLVVNFNRHADLRMNGFEALKLLAPLLAHAPEHASFDCMTAKQTVLNVLIHVREAQKLVILSELNPSWAEMAALSQQLQCFPELVGLCNKLRRAHDSNALYFERVAHFSDARFVRCVFSICMRVSLASLINAFVSVTVERKSRKSICRSSFPISQ